MCLLYSFYITYALRCVLAIFDPVCGYRLYLFFATFFIGFFLRVSPPWLPRRQRTNHRSRFVHAFVSFINIPQSCTHIIETITTAPLSFPVSTPCSSFSSSFPCYRLLPSFIISFFTYFVASYLSPCSHVPRYINAQQPSGVLLSLVTLLLPRSLITSLSSLNLSRC